MLIPPLVVNTKEVKQPFSSTKVHWLYFFFLILHFLHLYCYWLAPITWSVGIKHTYINKYVFCNLCQKLPMLILAWRPSLLSEEVLNVSSSLHIIDSISGVIFTISLWQSATNPPVLHVNTWSMLCFALQTHSCSKRLICLAYLNKTKSKNSRLIKERKSFIS